MASRLPQGMSWRSRRLWHGLGYGATALWMALVLTLTRGDAAHPLFKLIFAVPLAGWIIGVAAARLAGRLWPVPAPPEDARRERP